MMRKHDETTLKVEGNFEELTSLIRDDQLVIPEGITHIPNNLFNGCYSFLTNTGWEKKAVKVDQIVSITVPGTVKHVGSQAFAYCKNLEEVVFAEGVEQLGRNVFEGSEKLRAITLPSSMKHIDGWAFSRSGIHESVFSGDEKTLIYCPEAAAGSEYIVPGNVEVIGERAFTGLKALKSIVLPEGLKRICTRAFIGCGFSSVVIPKDTAVDINAFVYFGPSFAVHRTCPQTAMEKKFEYSRITGDSILKGSEIDLPQEYYWQTDEGFQKLTKNCAAGNVSAMEQMADYFRKKAQLCKEVRFYQAAEWFWRIRAYQYGSKAAQQDLVSQLNWDEDDIQLPSPGINEHFQGHAHGKLLNALGFTFFDSGREYRLEGIDGQGVVEVRAWESSDGPDSDGYGAEEFYDWWYLDEYLTLPEGISYLHGYPGRAKSSCYDTLRSLYDQVAGKNKNARN